MPHELPGWAIYVVIGLAVLCFAFLVAWMNERKVCKFNEQQAKDAQATIKSIDELACRLLSIHFAVGCDHLTPFGAVEQLGREALSAIAIVKGAKRSKEAALESFIGTNEILAKQINNVKAFVRDRQLTLRPKKGKLFVAFNESELEKVMNGEEIA